MLSKPDNAVMTIHFQSRSEYEPDPYPWHIDAEGLILNQDVWRGIVYRLLGFDYGKFPIVRDAQGHEYVYSTPIQSVTHYKEKSDE